MSKAFEMPPAYVGQIVHWKSHPGSAEPAAAVVTKVAKDVLALAVIHPGFHNLHAYDGVRHETDPRLGIAENAESGCWSHLAEDDGYLSFTVWSIPDNA